MVLEIVLGACALLLAIAIFWLARQTRQMALVTGQILALEVHPHLGVRDMYVGFEAPPSIAPALTTQIGLRLWNPGKVLVMYRFDSVVVTINGVEPPRGATVSKVVGVIHPGGEGLYFCPAVVIAPPFPKPCVGRVQFEASYWSIAGEEHKVKGMITLAIGLPPHPSWSWIFTEGPFYS